MEKSYSLILNNVISYLPSRLLIVLNSVIIIPLFAHLLDAKEMSIYLIALQILNITLTCSFDWISKAVLRFYEKYRLKDDLNTFFSNIFTISIIVYAIIFVLYFLFKDLIYTRLAIDNLSFLLTIILIIPCGIRQFLYQILRLQNRAKLYTLSIVMYQLAFILLFLGILQILPNASAILIAMNIAIFLIDMFIIKLISFNYKIELKTDRPIIKELLKYSIPLIFTNSCYWFILNISKLIFQNSHEYLNTAIVGVAWMLANSILPLLTVFIFASFPIIISKFETKKMYKQYFTNTVQLFCFILIPVISIFFYYSGEITKLFLPEHYRPVSLILPFFTMSIFLHELMKLINIKYHLKNKTYIEMIIAAVIAIIAYFMNITLIAKYTLLGAAVAMFVTELALIFFNTTVSVKNLDYLDYRKVGKTILLSAAIGILSYLVILGIFSQAELTKIVCFFKIGTFLVAAFGTSYIFRQKLLD